jgi:hypothetical protein
LRSQRGVPRRILDIAVAEISLDCPGIVAVIGELVAAGMPKHVGMGLNTQLAATARSTRREKPGADIGAPRSETNTKGDDGLSR